MTLLNNSFINRENDNSPSTSGGTFTRGKRQQDLLTESPVFTRLKRLKIPSIESSPGVPEKYPRDDFSNTMPASCTTPPSSRHFMKQSMKPRKILSNSLPLPSNTLRSEQTIPKNINKKLSLMIEQNVIPGTSGQQVKNSEKKLTKNKGKKKRYERKIKPCLYDSDDYNNSDSEKREKLSKWELTKIDENTGHIMKKTMFHIHYGVSVPYKNWKKALSAKTSYGFLREIILPHVWTLEDFVKRAVQIKRTGDADNRLELTPKKKEAVKRGYVQYLLERNEIPFVVNTKDEKKKRNARINKYGRELGIIIAQERAKMSNKSFEATEDTDSEESDQDEES